MKDLVLNSTKGLQRQISHTSNPTANIHLKLETAFAFQNKPLGKLWLHFAIRPGGSSNIQIFFFLASNTALK